MFVIQEQKWGEVSVNTWQNLLPHQWMCFRLALMDTLSEVSAQGVMVITDYSNYLTDTILTTQGVKIETDYALFSTITDMVVDILVSNKDYKTTMLEYVPWYEQISDDFSELFNSLDIEFRNSEQTLNTLYNNMFISTAIEALNIYERDLGIVTSPSIGYDIRRQQIASNYIATFDQTTEDTIRDVARAYSSGDVTINKTDITGVYEIKFVGTKGIPENMPELERSLDRIIPAHLGLIFHFVYNDWAFFNTWKWEDALNYTWEEFMEVS